MCTFGNQADEMAEMLEGLRLGSEQAIPSKEGNHPISKIDLSGDPVLGVLTPPPSPLAAVTAEIEPIDASASQQIAHCLEDGLFFHPHLDTEAGADPPAEPVLGIRTTLHVETSLADNQPGDILWGDVLHTANVSTG